MLGNLCPDIRGRDRIPTTLRHFHIGALHGPIPLANALTYTSSGYPFMKTITIEGTPYSARSLSANLQELTAIQWGSYTDWHSEKSSPMTPPLDLTHLARLRKVRMWRLPANVLWPDSLDTMLLHSLQMPRWPREIRSLPAQLRVLSLPDEFTLPPLPESLRLFYANKQWTGPLDILPVGVMHLSVSKCGPLSGWLPRFSSLYLLRISGGYIDGIRDNVTKFQDMTPPSLQWVEIGYCGIPDHGPNRDWRKPSKDTWAREWEDIIDGARCPPPFLECEYVS